MTLDRVYTLQDAIEEALEKTDSAPTRDVIRWLQMNRRPVLDDNSLTIEAEGLGNLVRAQRKKRSDIALAREIHNLCFDFGIEDLNLPDEISVPSDVNNLLYCACNWQPIDDATIDDLDMHVLLIEAQITASLASADTIRGLRQIVSRVVPDRTDIPLRELRRIARNGRES